MTDEQLAKAIRELGSTVAAFMEKRHIGHTAGIAILGTVLVKLYHKTCEIDGVPKERGTKYFNGFLDEMKIVQEEWLDYEEGDNETTEAN